MKKDRFSREEIKLGEIPFGKYIESYVIIQAINGSNETGRLIGFVDGYALLNPYVGPDFTDGKGLRKKLVDDVMLVNMQPLFSLTPTTEENVKAYCRLQNEESQRERLDREKKAETKKQDN